MKKRTRKRDLYVTRFKGVLDGKEYVHIKFKDRAMVISLENFNSFASMPLVVYQCKQTILRNKQKR